MIIGFTGTQRGMTQKQRATVRYLFNELHLTVLHHGDCVGADAEAHRDAQLIGGVTVHPPTDATKRAFCRARPNVIVLDPKPYLTRNKEIVAAAANGVIAAPKDFVAPASLRGQGTWTTIGYARKAGRRLWIVFPDGTFKEEAAREGVPL